MTLIKPATDLFPISLSDVRVQPLALERTVTQPESLSLPTGLQGQPKTYFNQRTNRRALFVCRFAGIVEERIGNFNRRLHKYDNITQPIYMGHT